MKQAAPELGHQSSQAACLWEDLSRIDQCFQNAVFPLGNKVLRDSIFRAASYLVLEHPVQVSPTAVEPPCNLL